MTRVLCPNLSIENQIRSTQAPKQADEAIKKLKARGMNTAAPGTVHMYDNEPKLMVEVMVPTANSFAGTQTTWNIDTLQTETGSPRYGFGRSVSEAISTPEARVATSKALKDCAAILPSDSTTAAQLRTIAQRLTRK